MKNVLEIKNVSKKIGKKLILDDITFDVKEGEVFGFVGPNGAGKTTLIKTMLGLYKQDSGFISIGGYDLNKDFEKAMEQMMAEVKNFDMKVFLALMDVVHENTAEELCDHQDFKIDVPHWTEEKKATGGML